MVCPLGTDFKLLPKAIPSFSIFNSSQKRGDVLKTVVITGGSRGIGAAAVELFAAQGHTVYFFYANNDAAAKQVAGRTGATAIRCDVSDGGSVRAAFRQIPDVDILICNAGIAHYGLLSMMAESDWDRLFDVNVKGIYHCVNAAMPAFLKKQRGCILTVSSMWGRVGASCEAAYSATKGAVIALTKALAKELGPSGIRVNCVCPGVILTDMCASFDEETLAGLAEETPLGRNGTPMDVAKAMAYLSEAEFVTGHILNVDGGFAI